MEFDIEDFDALRDYLAEHGYEKPGETVSLETLAGGVSNRTVKVHGRMATDGSETGAWEVTRQC